MVQPHTALSQGCTHGSRPSSNSAMIRFVTSEYRLARSILSARISFLLPATAPRPGRGRGGRQEGADRPATSGGLHPQDRNEEKDPRYAGCSPARSEEHTSELQSLMRISYAVFCLTKQKQE